MSGGDPTGGPPPADIPPGERSKYKMNLTPMTDEVRNRLFPGKEKLTKEDAQGVVPAGRPSSDVEGYAAICWYYVDDGYGNWAYWEEYC